MSKKKREPDDEIEGNMSNEDGGDSIYENEDFQEDITPESFDDGLFEEDEEDEFNY